MTYCDYEPLGGYVTINLKIKELKELLDVPSDKLKTELAEILARAEKEKQSYIDYAKQNEWMSLRLWKLTP